MSSRNALVACGATLLLGTGALVSPAAFGATTTSSPATGVMAGPVTAKLHAGSVAPAKKSTKKASKSAKAKARAKAKATAVTAMATATRVEAENYTSAKGVALETTTDTGGGKNLSYVTNGDWTVYKSVAFGTSKATKVSLRISSNGKTGSVLVRSGSTTGTVLATIPVTGTGGWQSWVTKTVSLSKTLTGTNTLALTFKSSTSADFVNVNWMEFDAAAAPTPTPTPTTAIPTPTPTTPTPTPTTASPTPTVTTPAPTPTVTTPAPTPTSASPTALSGWPGASNTGVPSGTTLTPSGALIITTAGAVIENLDISGGVEVRAANVTIRNCKIHGTGTYGLYVRSGSVTITDSEIYGGFENGIGFDNWTAIRVNIHGTSGDGVKLGSNVRLEDSWIHDLTPASGAHADGGQVQGGIVNTVVRHNWIDMNFANANAALFIAPDLGPSSAGPLTIEGNYVNGGNFTVYIVDGNNGQYFISNITFRDNKFGRNFNYGPMNVNVPVAETNNTYLDNGAAV